jgi:hypothetical protein
MEKLVKINICSVKKRDGHKITISSKWTITTVGGLAFT